MGPGAPSSRARPSDHRVGVAHVECGGVDLDRVGPRCQFRELGVQDLDRRLGRVRSGAGPLGDPPRQLVAVGGAGDLHQFGVRVGRDRLRLGPTPWFEPCGVQYDTAPVCEHPGRSPEHLGVDRVHRRDRIPVGGAGPGGGLVALRPRLPRAQLLPHHVRAQQLRTERFGQRSRERRLSRSRHPAHQHQPHTARSSASTARSASSSARRASASAPATASAYAGSAGPASPAGSVRATCAARIAVTLARTSAR